MRLANQEPCQLGTALADVSAVDAHWTCPFCSLLCDGLALEGGPDALLLNGSDCPRARAALGAHGRGGVVSALVDGEAVAIEDAIAVAVQRLAGWRQPLFGGMGTDLAGARALFRLAARTGAICDHADGEAMMHGLRALQDRGQFHTTLAEIRARADLLVCVGTQAVPRYPEFFRRCGLDRPDTPCARVVFLGVPPPQVPFAKVQVEHVPGTGDPFGDLQLLATLFARAPARAPDAAFAALAAALHAARYAVFVWEAGALPRHGALAIEMLHRIVMALNRDTRAASFALGGSDGAATVQQVFTWLSGLPLRTRGGSEYEPVRFAAPRLLADAAVDGLLWTWSFSPERLPPAGPWPRIVLGPPAMAAHLHPESSVFLPVATPGLDVAGHLFRTDGVVVPLAAARDAACPSVERVAADLLAALGTPA